MTYTLRETKGITKCLIDPDLDPQALRLHLSELAAGASSHAPHTHPGVEAFYILEGQGAVEVAGEAYPLTPNEAIVVDAAKPHGISNPGTTVLRYLVMNASR
jgi:mannose-6-phosphate isomerase-like protein (cupin superfamily)